MFGTLNPDEKHDWKSFIKPFVQAYNCTKQDSTSFSQYYLMFGREPNLPIDIILDNNTQVDTTSKSKCIESLKDRLKFSYNLALKNIQDAQTRQKRNCHVKIKSNVLKPDDLVLVKIVAFDGRHNLADKWENDPYVVINQPNDDIPVYRVKKQNGEGKIRVLHRNLLLPICSSSNIDDKLKPVPRKRKPVPKARKIFNHGSANNSRPCVENVDESISDSDNVSIVLYTLEQKPVEVDKVFNDSAATELDYTPVEESIDSNNVPHTDSNVQSDAETYSEHESEQSINTGSGTHQTDMFDDTVPENSFHRSSVNGSNKDEIEREIAIQSPNQNTQ